MKAVKPEGSYLFKVNKNTELVFWIMFKVNIINN